MPGAVTHKATATVESIEADAVTLSHGPIPSLQWSDMTMAFKKPVTAAMPHLKAGDGLEFEFSMDKEGAAVDRNQAAARGEQQVIARVIQWSIGNRFLVLLATVALTAWGIWAIKQTPARRPPRSIRRAGDRSHDLGARTAPATRRGSGDVSAHDDEVLSVPGAKSVRGLLPYFGRLVRVCHLRGRRGSVIWARSRVLEYPEPGAIASSPGSQAKVALGPDATGVGWIFPVRWR